MISHITAEIMNATGFLLVTTGFVLVAFADISVGSNTGKLCVSNSSKCSEYQGGVSVVCTDRARLPETPSFPDNIVSLDLSSCFAQDTHVEAIRNLTSLVYLQIFYGDIRTIKARYFDNLPALKVLYLFSTGVHYVEKGAFSELRSLIYLDLGFNYQLSLSQVPNIIHGLNQTKIKELYLDKTNAYTHSSEFHLKYKYVQALEYVSLDILSMSSMSIRSFDVQCITIMNMARCISFANNFLSLVSRSTLAQIELLFSKNTKSRIFLFNNEAHTLLLPLEVVTFNLRHKLKNMCTADENGKKRETAEPKCSPLTSRELRQLIHETIQINPDYTRIRFATLPKNLTHLVMDNSMRTITFSPMVVGSNRLIYWSIKSADELVLGGVLKGLTCLKTLALAGSNLIIQDTRCFDSFPSLRTLNLSDCNLNNQIRKASTSPIRNMPELRTLDLSFNGLSAETSLEYLVRETPKLELLFLDSNRITEIPKLNVPKTIKTINLKNNRIIYFHPKDLKQIEAISYLNPSCSFQLLDNPFQCQCNKPSFDFINWIQSTKVNLTDRELLTCTIAASSSFIQRKIVDVHACTFCSFWLHCYQSWVVGIASFFGAAILFAVVITIIYRKRWFLRYKIYSVKRKFDRIRCVCLGAEYTALRETRSKTVYVLYSKESSNVCKFIDEQLKNVIHECGYDAIFHDEPTEHYFLPVGSPYGKIIDAVNDSSCALVILTSEYMADAYLTWAEDIAFGRSLQYPLVIIFEEPSLESCKGHKHKIIRTMLNQGRFAKWVPEKLDEDGYKLFQDKLRNHLRRSSQRREQGKIQDFEREGVNRRRQMEADRQQELAEIVPERAQQEAERNERWRSMLDIGAESGGSEGSLDSPLLAEGGQNVVETA